MCVNTSLSFGVVHTITCEMLSFLVTYLTIVLCLPIIFLLLIFLLFLLSLLQRLQHL